MWRTMPNMYMGKKLVLVVLDECMVLVVVDECMALGVLDACMVLVVLEKCLQSDNAWNRKKVLVDRSGVCMPCRD